MCPSRSPRKASQKFHSSDDSEDHSNKWPIGYKSFMSWDKKVSFFKYKVVLEEPLLFDNYLAFEFQEHTIFLKYMHKTSIVFLACLGNGVRWLSSIHPIRASSTKCPIHSSTPKSPSWRPPATADTTSSSKFLPLPTLYYIIKGHIQRCSHSSCKTCVIVLGLLQAKWTCQWNKTM